MIIKSDKYLYLAKSGHFGQIGARLSSKKNITKGKEICLKLALEVDDSVFEDIVPTATITLPKDFNSTKINLRIG